MAECILCGKRANRHHACFYCGCRPMCLKCSCPCRTPAEKESIVAEVLQRLDEGRELPPAVNYVRCKKGHRYHQSIMAAAACDTD